MYRVLDKCSSLYGFTYIQKLLNDVSTDCKKKSSHFVKVRHNLMPYSNLLDLDMYNNPKSGFCHITENLHFATLSSLHFPSAIALFMSVYFLQPGVKQINKQKKQRRSSKKVT